MVATPVLQVSDSVDLRPATKSILPAMLDAYHEDSEAAQTALPWLDPNDDVRRQLRDMLYDIQAQHGTDTLHFWGIHDRSNDEFLGLIGLGDELQSLHSDFSLGYWVRLKHRRRGLASTCVDAVLNWLAQREVSTVVEIAVHPRNAAGLATAGAICQRWNGEHLEEFIGIEFKERTVPHHLHLVEVGPGA